MSCLTVESPGYPDVSFATHTYIKDPALWKWKSKMKTCMKLRMKYLLKILPLLNCFVVMFVGKTLFSSLTCRFT
uniref:Uncharacterized protein n=1 Tax=Magallana gigas TaxID=29159 RepID=A0A8W8KB06_MAGGI